MNKVENEVNEVDNKVNKVQNEVNEAQNKVNEVQNEVQNEVSSFKRGKRGVLPLQRGILNEVNHVRPRTRPKRGMNEVLKND